MLDNFEKDLQVYNSLKRKANGAIAWIIISGCVVLSLAYLAIERVIVANLSYSLQYSCEGVDQSWLANHPLTTSSLPKVKKGSEKIVLDEPQIDGYYFQGWFIKDTLVQNNTLNVEFFFSTTYRSKFADSPSEAGYIKLVAKYEPIEYSVVLELNGGELLNLSNGSYDGHKYVKNNNLISTTYKCFEEEFEFPTVYKEGYLLKNSAWNVYGTSSYITKCDPSQCKSFKIVAEWE